MHGDDVLSDEPLPVDTAANTQQSQNLLDLILSTVLGADYENDPVFGDIYNYLKYGTLSGDKERDFKTMLVESLYIVENDRLYRVSLPRNERRTADTSPLVVLPLKWCNEFISSLHCSYGHPSTRKLYESARTICHADRLFELCNLVSKSCALCQQTKINRAIQCPPS